MKGIIIKGIGGFYYIKTDQGVVRTKGKGIFRKEGIIPCVGDRVEINIPKFGDGVIERILPRNNIIIRPPISNVDTIIVVFAGKDPIPNFEIIDKFLIMAEKKGIEAILCLNKRDLITEKEVSDFLRPYKNFYKTFAISVEENENIETLKSYINGKVVALAGPSGVGKSSIINRIIPDLGVNTSEISQKSKRGRHTTRHVEIFDMPEGGMIFDTPGFTSFDIEGISPFDLDKYYPEFREYIGKCKFDDCNHNKEPGCEIIKAVESGAISSRRYNSYLKIFKYLEEKNRRNYG